MPVWRKFAQCRTTHGAGHLRNFYFQKNFPPIFFYLIWYPLDTHWIPIRCALDHIGFTLDTLHSHTYTYTYIHIGYILDTHWIHIQYPLDTHWINIGYTSDAHWIHIGYTLDKLWIHSGCFKKRTDHYLMIAQLLKYPQKKLRLFSKSLFHYWIHIG